jgi:hypothetical protein
VQRRAQLLLQELIEGHQRGHLVLQLQQDQQDQQHQWAHLL